MKGGMRAMTGRAVLLLVEIHEAHETHVSQESRGTHEMNLADCFPIVKTQGQSWTTQSFQ